MVIQNCVCHHRQVPVEQDEAEKALSLIIDLVKLSKASVDQSPVSLVVIMIFLLCLCLIMYFRAQKVVFVMCCHVILLCCVLVLYLYCVLN